MNKPNVFFTGAAVILFVVLTAIPPSRAAVVETWVQRYNGPGNGIDNPRAVAVDRSGNVIVTGYSRGLGGPIGCSDCYVDYFTAKYSQNGALLWSKRYNGPGNSTDQANALAVDAAGNVVVTGTSQGSENPGTGERTTDLYTAKYAAADGTLLWERRFISGQGAAVALHTDGNVVVAGVANGIDNGDIYTAKYAAADGALLWEKRYDRAPDDRGIAVAVDIAGNVVVLGIANNSDYYTAKYASANGALLWERHYNGPGNGQDRPAALALDAEGNAIVTGSAFVAIGNTDLYVTKYAAVHGATLWEKRYNGAGNSFDAGSAVAADDSGNIVVAGSSGGDYYTAKYATADGALLWERRYDGANNNDSASAVAIDGNDNVVVTGSSVSISNGTPLFASDYYTAKYATADGALLWEQRYNGPANGSDIVNSQGALALGPNGMVVVAGRSQSVSNNLNSDDFAIVVYRELMPPVITCPADGVMNATGSDGAAVSFTVAAADDSGGPPTVTCVPPSGSVFPIGQTTVTCTATDADGLSSACSFTVTVLGVRSIKENVLAELITLRATVTGRNDSRKLDEAIQHLTKSLAARLWVDETHPERKHGMRVFFQEKLTVRKLCNLIKSGKSEIPNATLQGLVERILQADRLLAAVAIHDAITADAPTKKIEQAQRFLARGDAEAGDEQCHNDIEHYRNSWRRASQ